MTSKAVWSAIWHPQSSFNKAFEADEIFNSLDGQKYYTWRAVRRQHINRLFSDIIHATIFLVIATSLGPEQDGIRPSNVAEQQAVGNQPGYGIVYQLGILAWWGFTLILSIPVGILWFPILQWIDPPSSRRTITKTTIDDSGVSHTVAEEIPGTFMHYAELFNYYMYTGWAYLYVGKFVLDLYGTIIHVQAKPIKAPSTVTASLTPVDVRKIWYTRLGLITAMLLGVALGAPVMHLWYWLKLVHVTRYEYAVIIVPVQMTLGIMVGSIFQAMSERQRQLPTTREIFEKDANGDLTLEGMRQMLNVLTKTEIDMETLQKIFVTRENKDQKGDDAIINEEVKKADETEESNDHKGNGHSPECQVMDEKNVIFDGKETVS